MNYLKRRKIIEKNYNAKCENLENRYVLSEFRRLSDCYRSYSIEKLWAFDECRYIERFFNAVDGKITSFNTFMFTYSFYAVHNKKPVFVHITKDRIEVYYL